MKKIKVYFFQKKGHRERQKDTVLHAPKEIEVVEKEDVDIDNLQVHKLHHKNIFRFGSKIVSKLPLINLKKLPPKNKKADFVYVWGCIPINSKKPYILELDNPYSITFYNKKSFNIYKPIIKKILKSKKCHRIVCISQACKNKLLEKIGKSIEHKVVVQYPYVKGLKQSKNTNKFRLLFIGFDFEGKGGFELRDAFEKVKLNNCELNIIGPKKRKETNLNIKWWGEQSRKNILEKHLPNNDVLCFPTYYESLGMVALEALSVGLGIITTDTFALPEMINKNGVLIGNPFLKKTKLNGKEIRDPTEYTLGEFKEKIKNKTPSKKLQKDIEKSLIRAKKKYRNWKAESKSIYNNKFSEKKWKESFKKIFDL